MKSDDIEMTNIEQAIDESRKALSAIEDLMNKEKKELSLLISKREKLQKTELV